MFNKDVQKIIQKVEKQRSHISSNISNMGERLKDLRTQKRLTQENVGEILLQSGDVYGKYERGKTLPSYENLVILADLFGTTTDYILRGSNSADG